MRWLLELALGLAVLLVCVFVVHLGFVLSPPPSHW